MCRRYVAGMSMVKLAHNKADLVSSIRNEKELHRSVLSCAQSVTKPPCS
jgi:uncharacterized UPF0146 family protein